MKKKSHQRLFLVVSILVLPTTYNLLPTNYISANTSSALSDQIETVKREREALLEEQRRLQADLDKITREGQSLGTAVKSLDASKRKLANDIRVTQSKIASTDLSIRVLENNMNTAERQIGTHVKAIANALQALSQYDKRSLVVDLLASASFSDTWRDRSTLASLGTKLDEEVVRLREKKTVLNLEKETKEKNLEQIASLQKELTGQKRVVEESQKAKERLLAETKNKEAEYQAMLAENLKRQREFEEDLYRLESELRITLDPTLIPDKKKGVLAWPLDKVYITQAFGDTSFSRTGAYAGKGHNGIDFRASQGTAVKAALSGVVEGTGNTDEQKGCYSYGRWILIRHGNGLSTVYAHLSAVVVQKGQEVGTGQLIGYSGGTPRVFGSGYSTGPHLHLGLFASQGVEVRQFTSSRACKQVSVPIADLKAYLNPLDYLPSI